MAVSMTGRKALTCVSFVFWGLSVGEDLDCVFLKLELTILVWCELDDWGV